MWESAMSESKSACSAIVDLSSRNGYYCHINIAVVLMTRLGCVKHIIRIVHQDIVQEE